MARRATAVLDSKTARLKLTPRKQSYFTQVADRLTLGYNRREQGAGKWTRRELVDVIKGRYSEREIGTADDYAPANGVDVFSFIQARGYVAGDGPKPKPASREPLTVRAAMEAYLTEFAGRSRHEANTRKTVERSINPVLGALRVARLTKDDLERWRVGLLKPNTPDDPDARRRSQDSANRLFNVLRAGLNHAFADAANHLPSDTAWRRIKKYKNVGRSRQDFFDAGQVRLLIAKAATFDKTFATLIEGAFLTGARYRELGVLNVGDFNAREGQLTIPECKTKLRVTTLSAEGVAFFKRQTAGRPAKAPLFPRLDGGRWTADLQKRPFKRAAALAELPESASFYTLRHTHISLAIDAGQPLILLAENVGTSVEMIQKHYFKMIAKQRALTIEKTAPKLRRVQ